MKNVMKSAIYMGKESVEIREVPIPEISDTSRSLNVVIDFDKENN